MPWCITRLISYPTFNAIMKIYFGLPSATLSNKSVKKPAGWDDMLNASLATATPEAALLQKMNRALYDNSTVIPISYGATMYAVTNKVHDTGLLTRGSTTHGTRGMPG